jgi:RNA polymerase sigma-70 factor (ECF subfamily)
VVLRTDGFVAGSALLRGADAVARATLGGARPEAEFRPVVVNGVAGVLVTLRGRPAGLMAFTIAGGKITAVDGITDPHRLRRLVSEQGLFEPPGEPGLEVPSSEPGSADQP